MRKSGGGGILISQALQYDQSAVSTGYEGGTKHTHTPFSLMLLMQGKHLGKMTLGTSSLHNWHNCANFDPLSTTLISVQRGNEQKASPVPLICMISLRETVIYLY